jgi:lysophospholipase L1-like esterase
MNTRPLFLGLLSVAIFVIMALGLTVAADLIWRAVYSPSKTAMAADLAFFEYRDYVVTTQPANLVLGNSKHIAERIFPEQDCRAPDGAKARFNSLGFRSPEFVDLPPKQSNEVRIIVAGGSAAMSLSVNESCTLAANVQRMLTERTPDKVFKVFTLGSGAWKSFQELVALQRYADDIKPDLIIAFDGFNDITHSFTSAVTPYGTWWIMQGYSRLREWLLGGPLATFQGIRIVHDLRELLNPPPADVTRSADPARIFPEFATPADMATRFELPVDRQRISQRSDFDPRNRKVVDQYLRNSRLMDFAAQNSGAAILHVLQPILYLKEPFSDAERKLMPVYEPAINYTVQGYLRASAGLEQMSKGREMARYLDLSAPFQGDASTYFRDYCHLNAAGYRIVSARIAEAASEMLAGQKK